MFKRGLGLAFFLLLIIGFASATTNISACGYLNGNNTEFTLNQSIDNGGVGDCITFNATNQTLDCVGFTIGTTGTGTGIYTAFNQSKINRCNISATSFIGIVLHSSSYSTVNNTNISSPMGTGLWIRSNSDYAVVESVRAVSQAGITTTSSHGQFRNCYAQTATLAANGILVGQPGNNNSFSNCTAISDKTYAVEFEKSSNNTFTNGVVIGNQPTFGAILLYDGSTGNTIANTSIDGMGGIGIGFTSIPIAGREADGNTLTNNTITNSSTCVRLDSRASGNTIVLNNFSNTGRTPDAYVNDSNGSNIYNATVSSKNQGNIYANVMDGSVIVSGTNNSSVTGLLIGNIGAGYPYNGINSLGKFICAAPCADNAPLTALTTNTSASLSSPSVGAPLYVFSVASCTNGTFVNANGNPENTSARAWKWYVNAVEVSGATSQTFAVSLYGLAPGAKVSCSENTSASGVSASYAYNTSNNITISDFSGGGSSGGSSGGSPTQTIIINGTNQSTQNLPTPSSFSDISKGTDEFLKSQTAGISNAGLVILGLLIFLWRGKGDGTGGFTSLIALFSIAIIYFYYSKYIFGG